MKKTNIIKSIISLSYMLIITGLLYSQTPIDYQQAKELEQKGYIAFADSQYDKAIASFQIIENM